MDTETSPGTTLLISKSPRWSVTAALLSGVTWTAMPGMTPSSLESTRPPSSPTVGSGVWSPPAGGAGDEKSAQAARKSRDTATAGRIRGSEGDPRL